MTYEEFKNYKTDFRGALVWIIIPSRIKRIRKAYVASVYVTDFTANFELWVENSISSDSHLLASLDDVFLTEEAAIIAALSSQ